MPLKLNIVMSLLLLSSNVPESYGTMTTSRTTTTTITPSIADVVQTFRGISTGGTGPGVLDGRTSFLDFFVTSSNSSGIVREMLLQSQHHQQHPLRVYNWPCLVLLSCIALAAFWGNVLVCLAVCCKRKLQSMFNCFLVSLALSDMMSAMLVMPLSILKTSVEPLPLPKFVCVAWYCLDVLFTSSTICHLCMISIDRYLTLTFPLRYGRTKRRKKQTIAKLAVVWVISTSIAGPLFILNMMESSHSDNELAVFKGCGPENPTFVISSTVISFYLPLLIMTVMYALTVKALQQQLKEQRRIAVTNSLASSSISGPSTVRGGLMRSKSDRRPRRSLRLKNDSSPQSDRNLILRNSTVSGRLSGQTRQVFGSMSKESTDSNDSIFKRWAKKVHDFTNRKSTAPDRSTTECLPNLEELLGTSDYSALTNATRSVKQEYIDATSTDIGTQSGGESSRTDAKRRAVRMDYARMDFSEEQKELTSPESVGPTEIITSTFKSSPASSESIDEHSIMDDSFLGAIINDDQFSETVGLIQNELKPQNAAKFTSSEDAEGSIGSLSDTANDHHEDIVVISTSDHQLHQTLDVETSLTFSSVLAETSKEICPGGQADYSLTKSPEQIFQSTTSDVSKATTPQMKRGFRPVNSSSKSANKISMDRSKWKCGSKLKNLNSRDLVTPIITVDLADESPPSHDGSECYNVALDLSVYTTNTPSKNDACYSASNSFETTTFISSKPGHEIETAQTVVKIPDAKQEALKEVHKFPPIKQLSLPTKRKTDTIANKHLNPDPTGISLTPSKLLSDESPNETDIVTGCTLSVPELSSLKRRQRNNSLLDINFNNQISPLTQRSPAGNDRRLTTSSLSTFNTPLRHRLSAVSASFGFRPSVCSTGSAGRYGLGCPDKGRRAVQVLGILFAVFVVCYLPFFALYLVNTTCSRCREYISQRTLAALEWLGYSGSLLNPIIYHIFSPDFRLAFHDLIRCRCCRQQKRKNFQLAGNTGKGDITRCTSARNYCRKPLCFAGTCRNCLGASKGKQPTGISSRQSDIRQSTKSQTNQTQESVVITFDS